VFFTATAAFRSNVVAVAAAAAEGFVEDKRRNAFDGSNEEDGVRDSMGKDDSIVAGRDASFSLAVPVVPTKSFASID
jgi:hypothetical protein